MDSARFDQLARAFAQARQTRRSVLAGGSLGLASALVGSVAARAQGTPSTADEPGATLFVQTAAGGTFLPNTIASPEAGEHGTHLLTLSGHPGQTIHFSDRPQRVFGQVATATFFDALGFTPDNPPNASLVVAAPDGSDDILVLELLNPIYDGGADLLLYETNILGEYAGEGLAPVADRQQDQELASEFAHASLFIDDCADLHSCYYFDDRGRPGNAGPIPGGPIGQCWGSWGPCQPDHPNCNGPTADQLNQRCNEAYPDLCQGSCSVSS